MIGRQIIRKIATSAARRSEHHDHGGYPGSNLPFPIDSRFKITALMIVFFGSAFSVPFLTVRHQLLK